MCKRLTVQVLASGGALDQRKIQLAVIKQLLQLLAVVDLYPDIQTGMAAAEVGQHRRHQRVGERRCSPHAKDAEFIPVFKPLLQCVKGIDDVQCLGVKLTAALGDRQPAPQPLKQPHAVVALQLLYGARDSRLRHMQLAGGAGDAFSLIDSNKDFQMSDGHRGRPFHIRIDIKLI